VKIDQLNMTFPGEGDMSLVIATDDHGTMLGTVCVKRAGAHVAEFARLFVREGIRRQGIGRALINRAVEVAEKAGCGAISCAVHPNNKAAFWFYTRLGFTAAFHFGDGDILMTRPVSAATLTRS
jgi:GNAT superfamily N-acetyltransferase